MKIERVKGGKADGRPFVRLPNGQVRFVCEKYAKGDQYVGPAISQTRTYKASADWKSSEGCVIPERKAAAAEKAKAKAEAKAKAKAEAKPKAKAKPKAEAKPKAKAEAKPKAKPKPRAAKTIQLGFFDE